MKYALIGCGRISTNHIKAAVNNQLEIAAVCDIVTEHMEAVLEKYHLEKDASIKRYTDYRTMLKEIQPALVSIATVSYTHLDVYKRQLKGWLWRKSQSRQTRLLITVTCARSVQAIVFGKT